MALSISETKLQEVLKEFSIIIAKANERKLPLLDFAQLVGGEVEDNDEKYFTVTFCDVPLVVLHVEDEGEKTFTFYVNEPLELKY